MVGSAPPGMPRRSSAPSTNTTIPTWSSPSSNAWAAISKTSPVPSRCAPWGAQSCAGRTRSPRGTAPRDQRGYRGGHYLERLYGCRGWRSGSPAGGTSGSGYCSTPAAPTGINCRPSCPAQVLEVRFGGSAYEDLPNHAERRPRRSNWARYASLSVNPGSEPSSACRRSSSTIATTASGPPSSATHCSKLGSSRTTAGSDPLETEPQTPGGGPSRNGQRTPLSHHEIGARSGQPARLLSAACPHGVRRTAHFRAKRPCPESAPPRSCSRAEGYLPPIARSPSRISMGIGKIRVEFFSVATSARV